MDRTNNPNSIGKIIPRDMTKPSVDNRKVFVVHGRNLEARDALFTFLRSIDLKPIEWSEAVKATGKGSPYVGEVLDAAFSMAPAVVVLMTPDDEAKLALEFLVEDDEDYERTLTGQCRPNVLFEAGMAMGRSPDQTILVELGKLRPFSDIGGRHTLKFDGGPAKRRDLANRLESAGCEVDLGGSDWISAGPFAAVIDQIKKKREDADNSVVVPDSLLTPELSFNCSRPSGHRNDRCSLQIRFVNTSKRTIRDFRIDMWFPNSFLNQNTSYHIEVTEKRTLTHRLFRVLPDFNRNQPLYPGDYIQPNLSYEVTDDQKSGIGLDEIFSIEIYVEDELTMKLERKMEDFVKRGK